MSTVFSYILCFEQDVVLLCPGCPGVDGAAADHKSGVIYSSGLFWRGQRKAINLPACRPSMSQHNNSKREPDGNRCHILNWKYFHSWDEDTTSSSGVVFPPHMDTALKTAHSISKCTVGRFWRTFVCFLSLRRDPSLPPSVSRPESLAFPTSLWPVVVGGLKSGGK